MDMKKTFEVARHCNRPEADIEILVRAGKMNGYRKEMRFEFTIFKAPAGCVAKKIEQYFFTLICPCQ
jgi:hypothetical protein